MAAMPPKKAFVDKSTTIRAASRNKQRSQPLNRGTASPYDSSAGTSLASSLSSLFSPQPHGKDAALASLLASSSKPPVQLDQASGLAAFGSFSNSKPETPNTLASKSLDEKQKHKRRDVVGAKAEASGTATSSTSTTAKQESAASSSKQTLADPPTAKDRVQKQPKPASTASLPVVPNVPAGRKPVFRPVLASSTAVSWPEMPVAGSKTVLHTLIELLAKPDVQAALHRDLGWRTRSRASRRTATDTATEMDVDAEPEPEPSLSQLAPPQVLAGINSITRAIEDDIARDLAVLQTENLMQDDRQKAEGEEQVDASPPSVRVVFVCRHDLPQPSLIAHIPMLITARNAVLHVSRFHPNRGVLLFALPSGSESLLASALNLRRASVVSLTTAFPAQHLEHLISSIYRETGSACHLRAHWLETAIRSATHQPHPLPLTQRPTSIKLLRTTQPVDLNERKAAKRIKRKDRSAAWKKRKMQLQQRVKTLKAQLKAYRKRGM